MRHIDLAGEGDGADELLAGFGEQRLGRRQRGEHAQYAVSAERVGDQTELVGVREVFGEDLRLLSGPLLIGFAGGGLELLLEFGVIQLHEKEVADQNGCENNNGSSHNG